jgi:hypothetical protein
LLGVLAPANQVTDVKEILYHGRRHITLRAQSSYISTLYLNGFTRSVTLHLICDCAGGDPCVDVDKT